MNEPGEPLQLTIDELAALIGLCAAVEGLLAAHRLDQDEVSVIGRHVLALGARSNGADDTELRASLADLTARLRELHSHA